MNLKIKFYSSERRAYEIEGILTIEKNGIEKQFESCLECRQLGDTVEAYSCQIKFGSQWLSLNPELINNLEEIEAEQFQDFCLEYQSDFRQWLFDNIYDD